jgi:hypothetical protein
MATDAPESRAWSHKNPNLRKMMLNMNKTINKAITPIPPQVIQLLSIDNILSFSFAIELNQISFLECYVNKKSNWLILERDYFIRGFDDFVEVFHGGGRAGFRAFFFSDIKAGAAGENFPLIDDEIIQLLDDIEFGVVQRFYFHALGQKEQPDLVALLEGQVGQPERVPGGFRVAGIYDNA